ncbi:MAG: ASCH domain-containing protein [Gemmatimonadetes bacterium]|nr:ASCH domain-containing protein [Gemmatimonadota bacterium]
MSTITEPLLFSLKPCYADLVFEGLKKAELRRRIASSIEGRDVFIYVSSPVKQLRGGFRVGHVWQGSPEEVWNEVSELAGVDKRGFDAYYEGREIAYALQITDVWEYENPTDLNRLRKLFPNFVVPQSWRYVKPEEYRSFQNMKRQIKEEVFNG